MQGRVTGYRMPQDLYPQLATGDAEIGMLRLRTLVRLRWLAIVGQTGAVLGVHFVLGFPLPLGLCLAVIAFSAWLNIFLTIRWRKSIRLHETHAGLLLVYDVLQLAA
jgi:two-component system sensor histidine kinase RegB